MINYRDCNKTIEKKIQKILQHYVSNLDRNIQNGYLQYEALAPNLSIMSAMLKLDINSTECERIIHFILDAIKNNIEKGNVRGMGALGGLTEIALSVSNFHEQNGFCEKFKDKIDLLVQEQAKMYLDYCLENKDDLRMTFYDLTVGLTGVGMYILKYVSLKKSTVQLIKKIIVYLVSQYNKNYLIVKPENDKEKRLFPEGNLNMGVAHGIVGCILFLAYAYKSNIIVLGQQEMISEIFNTYRTFEILQYDNVITWPSQISVKDYKEKEKKDIMKRLRMSWCYGASGISRCLYLAAKWTRNSVLCNKYYQNLVKISQIQLEDYHLDSAIVCHGYSGLMVILDSMNLECHSRTIETKVNVLLIKILELFNEAKEYGFVNFIKEYKDNQILTIESEQHDVLLGASGVILSLLAIATNDNYIKNQLFII